MTTSLLKRAATDRTALLPTGVVVFTCLLYVAGVLLRAGGDPGTFAVYDGHFSYQIALRLFEATPFLDVPAYRYQRLLYPLLARLLALGQPILVPWTLIGLNVAAIGLGTWATERLLDNLGINRWYALVYGLYGGQLVALRTNLNEPVAMALVALAMLAWARERRGWAAVAFALALLTKETTAPFLAAYGLYSLRRRLWPETITLGASVAPFAIYQIALWTWLGRLGLGAGGAGATSFSPIPLAGWLQIAQLYFPAFLILSLMLIPMSIIPAVTGVFLSARSLLRGLDHPFVYCLLLNAIAVLFLPNSTFRELAAMVRLTQGVAVSMLLYGALTRSGRILNYSVLWIFTNVLIIRGVA